MQDGVEVMRDTPPRPPLDGVSADAERNIIGVAITTTTMVTSLSLKFYIYSIYSAPITNTK